MPAHRNFFVTNTVDGHCIPVVKYTQRTLRGFAPCSREEKNMFELTPDAIEAIQTPAAFAAFLDAMRQDFRTHPETWQNRTLDDYFEALSAYARDTASTATADFAQLAKLLYIGKIYE